MELINIKEEKKKKAEEIYYNVVAISVIGACVLPIILAIIN